MGTTTNVTPAAGRADTLGMRFRLLRLLAGETQLETALALNTDPGTVSRWERDETEPQVKKIAMIARHFNVTTDHILLDHNAKAKPSPALARFRKSELGQLLESKGWMPYIESARFPKEPDLQQYIALATVLLAADERGEKP